MVLRHCAQALLDNLVRESYSFVESFLSLVLFVFFFLVLVFAHETNTLIYFNS